MRRVDPVACGGASKTRNTKPQHYMKTMDPTTARPRLFESLTRLKPAVALALHTMRLILALGAALLASAAAVHAQTWQTVDDADGATGELVYQITSDSAGNISAAGTMRDATERYHAVIMKCSDSGATRATVVDYSAENDLSAPNGAGATFQTITSADVGGERHLVATGFYRRVNRAGYTPQWLTIRSKDGGATWETLDEYVHPVYYPSLPQRRCD
jgi:hypothetical protein